MAFSPRAVEEVAKFEQKISLRRGRPVTLENTPVIKSLAHNEKLEFLKYLKHKRRNLPFLIGFLVLTLLGAVIFRYEITGRVISENTSNNFLSLVFSCLFVLALILIFAARARETRISKAFKRDSKLAEKLLMR